MAREIPRTVQSFLPPYQHDLAHDEIEIIVLENGSDHRVDSSFVDAWPKNVRYVIVDDPKPSPAHALNIGVEMCSGDWVCPVIDGARMVTPGLFKNAKVAMGMHPNPIVATVGYHLGPITQQLNVENGYNQNVEDDLLRSIEWPEKPYRLFDISCLGGSARGSWLEPIAESNVIVLRKTFYQSIGGFDETFDFPGGGLVNLDFFKRCIEHSSSQYILLVGEASFHQYHGGVTTSRSTDLPSLEDETKTTWDLYAEQYSAIRGEPYQVPQETPIIFGEVNPHVVKQTMKASLYINALKNPQEQ